MNPPRPVEHTGEVWHLIAVADMVDLGPVRVALAVDASGQRWPWIVATGVDVIAPTGCTCSRCAPHEQDGELPARYRQRLALRGAP